MNTYLKNQLDNQLIFQSDTQKRECMATILAQRKWNQNEIDTLILHTQALQNAKIEKFTSYKDFLLTMRLFL